MSTPTSVPPSPSLPMTERLARGLYALVLRLMATQPVAAARAEMLDTFDSACRGERRRHGLAGVCRMTAAELWDLIRLRLTRSRSARITASGPTNAAPERRRSNLRTDVAHAWRALRARRAETAVAAGLLALGLATTGAIFAVADALLIHPIPYPQPEGLVQLWSKAGRNQINSMPRDLAVRWLERHDLFERGAAFTQGSALVTSNGDPESIPAGIISPGLLETLGVRPILGRSFTADEGRAGTDHVAIISTDLWMERFGGAPDVVGRRMTINSSDYTVVGVMDRTFRFPASRQRIWLPFDIWNPPPARVNSQVTPIVRVRAGITRAALTSAVEAAGGPMAKLASRPWQFGATTRFMDQILMDASTRRSIWLLFGATVLLMLVVCANVANLGLSQAFSRARDAAIRAALGASRWRLVRQALIEQVTVGLIALAAAVPLAAGALRVAVRLLPISYTLSSLNTIDVDGRLLLMMTALAIAAPVIAGLVPALAGSRPAIVSTLKSEGRSVSGSRASRRFRQGLVVIEVACSVVLLVSAALLVRSFARLQQSDTGYDNRNLISANIGFPAASFADGVASDLYLDQALARLRQIPGVLKATTASGVPPENGGIRFGTVEVEGVDMKGADLISAMYEVQPDFFDTMGMTLVEGRSFTPDEPAEHVIVSQALAAEYWPNQTAIGKRFRWEGEPWHEVVGVAPVVRESAGNTTWPQTYWPLQRHHPTGKPAPSRDEAVRGWQRFAIRVDDPARAMPLIRSALRQTNPAILVQAVDRVDDLIARDLDRPRFLLALMVVFAGAGLLLAAAGVYSVLSCLVAEQLREYGIRLMLGAPPARLMRAILAGGLATTAVGLVLGAAVAAALGKTIATMLFEVQPRDPLSYSIVAAVLVAAAVAAAWRPARRAGRVDPVTLLRND